MLRDKEKEITPHLDKLKLLLLKVKNDLSKTDENIAFDFWKITNGITEGFQLLEEEPDHWKSQISADVLYLYKTIGNFRILESDLLSIRYLCEEIFYISFGRSIKDEERAPSIMSFYHDKKRMHPLVTHVLISTLSLFVGAMYSLLHFWAEKFSWTFLSDNVFPFVIGLYLTIFLTDRSYNWIRVNILCFKWKIEWHIKWYSFYLVSKLKYKVSRIYKKYYDKQSSNP